MDKVRYGKWASSIAVGVLLTLLSPIIAQPGFLNIDCAGKTNGDNLTWVADTNYIDVGQTVDTGNSSLPSYLQSLRLFPKPLNKSCYKLRVTPNVRYLLTVWWAVGNSSGFKNFPSFTFSIETAGMLAFRNITIRSYPTIIYGQRILVSSGRVLYICFIRTSEINDPFVNAIQLRTLGNGMYEQAKPGTMLRVALINTVGGNSTIRYPQDSFDRQWTEGATTMTYMDNLRRYSTNSTRHLISTNNTKYLPPTAVMQTAWIQLLMTNKSVPFPFDLGPTYDTRSLLLLYFAEIEELNMSEPRSFHVTINGETSSETVTLVQAYSVFQLTFLIDKRSNLRFELVKASNSIRAPILNALEYYQVLDTQPATYSQDIKAISVIKRRFDIKEWVSDPCFFIPWEGIGCDNSSSIVRISRINLSGRNLTGSVSEH